MDKHQYSKVQIALIQLNDSIILYKKKSYVSSISLAACAEQILGDIAFKAKGDNALTREKIFLDQLADNFKVQRPSSDKVKRERNKIKNELKHNDEGDNYPVEHDYKFEAEEFIIGAINNYEIITGQIPKNVTIRNF